MSGSGSAVVPNIGMAVIYENKAPDITLPFVLQLFYKWHSLFKWKEPRKMGQTRLKEIQENIDKNAIGNPA